MPESPRRALTDWTTVSGLAGAGQLALVTGGAAAEGIHLATLGFEVLVAHSSQADAASAERAQHVHHVAVDLAALPPEWSARFGLVVAFDEWIPADALAPNGLAVVIAEQPVDLPDLTRVVHEPVADDPTLRRTVLVRLGS